jgi:hypothetical protein
MDSIEKLPFYEYQIYIDKLNSKIEAENKKNSQGDMVEAFNLSQGKI